MAWLPVSSMESSSEGRNDLVEEDLGLDGSEEPGNGETLDNGVMGCEMSAGLRRASGCIGGWLVPSLTLK